MICLFVLLRLWTCCDYFCTYFVLLRDLIRLKLVWFAFMWLSQGCLYLSLCFDNSVVCLDLIFLLWFLLIRLSLLVFCLDRIVLLWLWYLCLRELLIYVLVSELWLFTDSVGLWWFVLLVTVYLFVWCGYLRVTWRLILCFIAVVEVCLFNGCLFCCIRFVYSYDGSDFCWRITLADWLLCGCIMFYLCWFCWFAYLGLYILIVLHVI